MATYPLTWMPDVLRGAGCTVVEEPGWETRGQDGSFDPDGIMLHHDASPEGETSHGADVIINGRPGLEGLLAQIWLDYDGAWHLCGAGLAHHAGEGSWQGITAGNKKYIGIETDHTSNEEWTADQRTGGITGLVALSDKLGIRRDAATLKKWLIAHKEWAPSRKVDPDPLNMNDLRAVVLNPPAPDEGAPVETLTKSSSKTPRHIGGDWTNLQLSDKPDDPTGNYAVRKGPADWFSLSAQFYVQGEPGTIVQVRPWKDGSDSRYSLRQAVIDANGYARLDLAQQGSLESPDWLRIEAWASDDATVTAVNSQIATW
jgi:hypothetical protein